MRRLPTNTLGMYKLQPTDDDKQHAATDASVWLTETPAPSDFLFVVCCTNVLTY